MTRTHWITDSPLGDITLVADDAALCGLYMHEHRHLPAPEAFGRRDPAAFAQVRAQLDEYFAGERQQFELPLAAAGTPFQREVWRALHTIPYGRTWTYGELASAIGRPTAVRAVGAANGRNPISIIVPCHRVIGSTGAMTGYGGGIAHKTTLLQLEGALGTALPGVDELGTRHAHARGAG
jgi:methylated-DNA-[protein]-cysteine S-methyltransferase